MIVRLLILLIAFFCCTSIKSQEQNWQYYSFIEGLYKTVETKNELYSLVGIAVLVVDKTSFESKMINLKELGLSYCRDIYLGKNESVFFVGSDNKIVERTSTGIYEEWVSAIDEEQEFIYTIAGQNSTGELILQLNTGDIIIVSKHGDKEIWLEQGGGFGLIQGAIVDASDFLWLWRGGILKSYDQDGFLVESKILPDDHITRVLVDSDGLLFTTSSGVYYYYQETQQWSQMSYVDLGLEDLFFIQAKTNAGLAFLYDQHIIYISTEEGELIVERTNTEFPKDYRLSNRVYVDSTRGIWFVDPMNVAYTYWKGDFVKTLDVVNGILINDVKTIAEDPDGNIWLGGSGSIATLMGGKWNNRRLSDDIFSTNTVYDIAFTKTRHLLLGMSSSGFFSAPESQVLIEKTNAWDTLHQAFISLSFLPVTDVKVDQKQNIWVLRAGDALFSVYSQGEWHRFLSQDMPVNVSQFNTLELAPDGKIWIGTDNGVLIYDGYDFKHISAEDLFTELGAIYSISFDNKELAWIAVGNEGIRTWDGKQTKVFEAGNELPEEVSFVNYIAKGVGDDMWAIWPSSGLLHFDGREWKHVHEANSGLLDDHVFEIMADSKNRVWFLKHRGISVLHSEGKDISFFELKEEEKLRLMPNPTLGRFQLHWRQAVAGKVAVHIVNNLGQVVQQWHYGEYSIGEHNRIIDRPNLSPALYYVQLYVNDELLDTQPLLMAR